MSISIKDIKDHIVVTIKETIKFVLHSMVTFLLIGVPMAYVFVDILKMNGEISGIIVGIVTAMIIIIIDYKKIHSLNNINDSGADIWKKI